MYVYIINREGFVLFGLTPDQLEALWDKRRMEACPSPQWKPILGSREGGGGSPFQLVG